MKLINFLIFLSIFLAIYGSINFYIFIRGWQAIPKIPALRIAYIIFFLFIAISYFTGRIVERFDICLTSDICIWVGSFWLGLMTYLLLSILLIDILRVLNHFLHFFPSIVNINYEKTKLIAALCVILISLFTVITGYINARIPVVKKLELRIPKKTGNLESLRIAMASDIHLGTLVSNSRLEILVNIINKLKPDIVLLPGDILDEDIEPVVKKNLGDTLTRIKSKYGVYAATGNHEFIGGVEAAVQYLEEHNITVLRDRFLKIDNIFYIIGRDDRSNTRFTGQGRKSLKEIITGIDCTLPVILMDHQPFSLQNTADTCVDLQVSGHTHHGQLWPFNFITSKIYEISRGYLRKGNTHFYVSSGYGTWGPPIRTNSRPEIVEITLHFKNE